ncbi:MAG: SH3 type 3 domain protein [Microgenomates group bacterium GW2011_GWA2_39_19]|nr:MAG: SH3 type 3 domain protein [Microgenomates group bacterium GW2011_GWA2_39_19]
MIKKASVSIFIFIIASFIVLIYQKLQFEKLDGLISPYKLQSNEVVVSPLTIDQIFRRDHENMDNTITLIATGDVMLGRVVNQKSIASNNFNWPFEKTSDLLKSVDITLVNLEGPITNDCKPTGSGMVFCADKRTIGGLAHSGIDIANIANNHIGNYGEKGEENTKGVLKIAHDINIAKENASVVVVSFHWGVEYKDQPTKRQEALAHLAVDSGADLIIGNHPHWYQPIEVYKNKVIVYSHGNFIFDQMWSQRTREGVVGKYTFSGSNLVDVEFVPVVIENFGQPRLATEEEKNKILTHMEEESKKLEKSL